MSNDRRRAIVWNTLLLWVCLAGVQLPAQDPVPGLMPPKGTPARSKLVVLKTGQVLFGEAEARLGGYTVQIGTGSIVVPYDQVRTAAESLPDAYSRICKGMHSPNANDHLELARWCVRVGLADAAREQLQFALQLEPHRAEARALLVQLARQQPGSLATQNSDFQPAARLTSATLPATTAGLSGDRVAEYVRQIQPSLLNSCATGACHGGQQAGALQLRSVGRLTRSDSDFNLETVLRFIDATTPDASPLVVVPRQANGPHTNVFRGPKAQEQFDRLLGWTRLVAGEMTAATRSKITRGAAPTRNPSVVPAAGVAAAVAGPPPGDAAPPAQLDDAFLRQVLAEEQADAFDPAEFNRRVHGTP